MRPATRMTYRAAAHQFRFALTPLSLTPKFKKLGSLSAQIAPAQFIFKNCAIFCDSSGHGVFQMERR
jgi:hypothetical protein